MGKYVDYYCGNGNKVLKKITDPILQKFWSLSPADYDDFYSIGALTVWDCEKRFDKSQGVPFEPFLKGCLKRKFYTEMTARGRDKRINKEKNEDGSYSLIQNYSLEASIGGELLLENIIASDFDIDKELNEEIGISNDDRVQKYFNALSDRQRRIANLIMCGYSHNEIKKELNLTEKQYIDSLKDMKTFEKSRILKHVECNRFEEEKHMQESTQTLEKSKPDKLSITSIIKKIDNYTIRFDHPLQRESEQWSPAMKGNLISDILQRNPIPPLVFAEQVANGLAIIWDLDGKQRCTNVYAFKNDGFKITKNIRRWNISYQARVKENGKQVLDENGFPESERRDFDIRGKKFSDLPEELKDRFLEYNFEIVQYLNCSSEDIAYHIARYNEGKPMSASQKGITRLGEEFAAMVKSISAMPFFKEQGGYKVSEGSNGTVNRVVVESVMAANFLEDWKKKQEDMCEFMKENATSEMFDNFEDMVGRISAVGTEETFSMFDSKDSFIWFGLYARFINTGLEDEKFIDFMAEFSQSLHSKKVGDISYDELNSKSTKDRAVVIAKIDILEKLMNEYLGLKPETNLSENNVLDFVKQNVSSELTDDDLDFCEDMLTDLTLLVDNGSELLKEQNHLSIIGIVAYAFKNDIDLDEWFVEFFSTNNTYIKNQKENLVYMINSLKGLCMREKASA